MRLTIALLMASLPLWKIHAQLEGSNWFFGDSVLVKFTEDSIYVTKAYLSTEEGSSTISDKEGNLLFYTNSGYIYNKIHEPIHNEPIFCYGYDPLAPEMGNVIPESALLLQNPILPDSLFYLLNFGDGLLDYTEIDARSLMVFGALVDTTVGSDLSDSIISCDVKLTAVRHGNGRDWWIFMRTAWTTEPPIKFLRWLLNPNGFEGPDYVELSDWVEEMNYQHGNMIFSQSGERLAVVEQQGFEIYDFDRCSGELVQTAIVEDIFDLGETTLFYYGALNNSGNLLYLIYHNYNDGDLEIHSGIYQFDLSYLPDISAVRESGTIIYAEEYNDFALKSLKYEPISDQIYFVFTSVDSLYSHNLYLHAITEPELIGVACDVQENYLQLSSEPAGMRTRSGLPNMPNYSLGALLGSPCDTIDTANILSETLLLSFQMYPNPVTELLNIYNPFQSACKAKVFNAQGQAIQSFLLQPGNQVVDVSLWPQGSYSLLVYEEEKLVWSSTLVKME